MKQLTQDLEVQKSYPTPCEEKAEAEKNLESKLLRIKEIEGGMPQKVHRMHKNAWGSMVGRCLSDYKHIEIDRNWPFKSAKGARASTTAATRADEGGRVHEDVGGDSYVGPSPEEMSV